MSEFIGWWLCYEMSYPDPASALLYPLAGPSRVAVTLTKQDRGLQQYLVEAAYNYVPQVLLCCAFLGICKFISLLTVMNEWYILALYIQID